MLILSVFFAEIKIESIFALAFRGFSSVGSEHLPYKQRVGGSTPSTPTNQKVPIRGLFFYFVYIAVSRYLPITSSSSFFENGFEI
jgi:hypothetical protein